MRQSLEDILRILNDHKDELEDEFKVQSIGVFGSFSRNEQTDSSDIDILVSFRESVGFEFIDLADHLESLLEMRVDLVTQNALRPRSRDQVLKEVVFI